MALYVTEGIFAVLYVSIMGLTGFYKTTVIYIYMGEMTSTVTRGHHK